MVDHLDIAIASFNESNLPDPPRTVEDVRPYLMNTLKNLPDRENFGYVLAPPGGENSIFLEDGAFVRVGRVMTPDGQIYKIMNDVPNGGPQWVAEDIRPELYHPYNNEVPEPNPDLEDRVVRLEIKVVDLQQQITALEAVVEANRVRMEKINERLELVDNTTYKKHNMPTYTGRAPVFGGTVNSRPV